MSAALQVPQDPVAKHQPFEEPNGPLDPAIAHDHFQRAMAKRASTRRAGTVCILAAAEGHGSSPATRRPAAGPHRPKEKTPQGSGPRGVSTQGGNRLNLRQAALYGHSGCLSSRITWALPAHAPGGRAGKRAGGTSPALFIPAAALRGGDLAIAGGVSRMARAPLIPPGRRPSRGHRLTRREIVVRLSAATATHRGRRQGCDRRPDRR